MKKVMRLLVFTGALALMASPVFADGGSGSSGSGPGTGNPPPQTGSDTTTSTSTSATTTIVTEILSVLGAVEI